MMPAQALSWSLEPDLPHSVCFEPARDQARALVDWWFERMWRGVEISNVMETMTRMPPLAAVPASPSTHRALTWARVETCADWMAGDGRNQWREAVFNAVAVAIDAHAAERLRRFAAYPAGWDDGLGEPLQEASLRALGQLLTASLYWPPETALFMSARGQVVLNWIGRDGCLVEIELYADRIGCFVEASAAEFDLPLNTAAIQDLLARHG